MSRRPRSGARSPASRISASSLTGRRYERHTPGGGSAVSHRRLTFLLVSGALTLLPAGSALAGTASVSPAPGGSSVDFVDNSAADNPQNNDVTFSVSGAPARV